MKAEADVAGGGLAQTAKVLSPGPALRRRSRLLAGYLVTVLLLLSLNFFLPRAMPGDPITAMLAGASSAGVSVNPDDETKASLKRYYGLDRPVGEQFVRYLGGLATGDMGTSIKFNQPVFDLLLAKAPWTLLLAGASLVMAIAIGIPIGIYAGWRRGSRSDRSLVAFFTLLSNFPAFFVASMALYVFSVKLRWVPLSGASTAFAEFGPFERVLNIAHHLVLPATILALQAAAGQFLLMRAGMVSELGADYLLMGRAKGLAEGWLKYRYAARNALLPTVSLTSLMLGFAVAGTIFIETVFAYPGLGRLAFDAAGSRDYPLMQGTFLLLSLSVVTFNLVADLVIARLDPRTVR